MTSNRTANSEVLQQAQTLIEGGSWDEAIAALTAANRKSANAEVETALVKLRHLAFDAQERPAPTTDWPPPVPDHFPETSSIPEIAATDLSVDAVRSAILHHGSIVVRGLFSPQLSEMIRMSIDAAFAGAEAVVGQKTFEPTPWFTHFEPANDIDYSLGALERHFVRFGAGVLAVDSPRALFHYLECLHTIGFQTFLHEYFGERPALSAKKSTLRRTPPNASAGWHQDGGYFQADVRALNLWAAFSRCGVDAPSIDMFARRFDHIVQRGVPGVAKSDAVSNESAAEYGLEHAVRLMFEPGDALLFDEMALHRTGVDESMTRSRYAVEMWFFAASMFPHEQIPLYL